MSYSLRLGRSYVPLGVYLAENIAKLARMSSYLLREVVE